MAIPIMGTSTDLLNPFLSRSCAALKSPPDPLAVHWHVVMGNEAADPDSCASAIVLAAALDAALDDDAAVVVPLIPVPRDDFRLQLDRVHLLRRAGLAGEGEGPGWTPSAVAFADELDLSKLAASGRLHLHLVDHNALTSPFAALGPHVTSIIDHHADQVPSAFSKPTTACGS